MPDITQQYLEDVYRKWRYLLTWPPGKPRRLGDVGVFERGAFDRRTSLRNLGIDFDVREDVSPTDYTHYSSRGIDTKWKTEARAADGFEWLTDAQVGGRIEFSRENAFVFSAPECYEHEIEDQHALKQALLERLTEPGTDWDGRYRAITDLVHAASVTVLISGGPEAAVELEAVGDVGASWFSLAGIGANARVADSRNMALAVVGTEVTPLFQYLRPNQNLLEKLLGLVGYRDAYASVDVEGMGGTAEGELLLDAAYEDEEVADALFAEGDVEDVLASL